MKEESRKDTFIKGVTIKSDIPRQKKADWKLHDTSIQFGSGPDLRAGKISNAEQFNDFTNINIVFFYDYSAFPIAGKKILDAG